MNAVGHSPTGAGSTGGAGDGAWLVEDTPFDYRKDRDGLAVSRPRRGAETVRCGRVRPSCCGRAGDRPGTGTGSWRVRRHPRR